MMRPTINEESDFYGKKICVAEGKNIYIVA